MTAGKDRSANRKAAHRGDRAGLRRGFTLVELLTIIIIIGMLVALVSPAVTEARKQFKVTQSRAIIEQVKMGINMYKNDMGSLPPSDGSYPAPGGSNKQISGAGGAAGLVQCLLGYLPKNDDGLSGPGFRTVKAGKKHGPYVSQKMIYAGDPSIFQDAFANDILYYRWESTGQNSGAFRTSDNSNKGPTNIMTYVRNPHSSDTAHPYYREDYLILSPGPDRQWAKPTTETEKVDDIANFKFQVKETQQ